MQQPQSGVSNDHDNEPKSAVNVVVSDSVEQNEVKEDKEQQV